MISSVAVLLIGGNGVIDAALSRLVGLVTVEKWNFIVSSTFVF